MAKSTQEAKLVDELFAKAKENKDLLQNFENDVTHEKNMEKNIQKRINTQQEAIKSRFSLYNEVTNKLEAVQENISHSLIEELQEKVKYTPEELADTNEEENLILVIARAYMVSSFVCEKKFIRLTISENQR